MAKKISKSAVKTVVKARTSKTKTASAPKARKARVVSFTVAVKNGKRSFTVVNKRAKAFGELAGSTTLKLKHLKAIKALGFRVVESGTLEPIAL